MNSFRNPFVASRLVPRLTLALVLATAVTTHGQLEEDERDAVRPLPHITPTAACEILMPPGTTTATFQATSWTARLAPGGPIILGVVPYTFDANVDPTNRGRALASMQEIEGVCDVQFVPRNAAIHPNWIHVFAHPSANNSFVGMIGGQQIVNITSWPSNQPNVNFIIVHELLHALGFWHEHQRADRDNPPGTPFFIAVNAPCITPASLFNFDIVQGALLTGTYDFGSLMHYGQCAFAPSCATCPAITVQPPFQVWQTLIGQRVQLSQTDIDGLCARYGCTPVNNTCQTAIPVTNGTTITDTRGATTSAAAACGSLQRDAWYVYDAPCTGQVTIALDTPSAGYAPALAVYLDPCGAGAQIACDTTAPVQASFPVTAGERYFLRVGGIGVTPGTARLQIACAPINCVASLQWAQAATAGPSPRRNHAMVYDSTRQRVILFGGGDIPALGDTWEWDPVSQSWSFRTSSGPSARSHHAMAYDAARQRVVLFGGLPNLGDTWEYDPIANNWIQRSSTGPLGRDNHAMAYDTARQQVVLFGGTGQGFTGDTWEWNGTTGQWTLPPVVGTVPPERSDFGMAYDASRAVTVMWGGHPTDTSAWEWNGTQWTERPSGFTPPLRTGHELVFDPLLNRVLLYGGWAPGPVFHDDIWSWNGGGWTNHGHTTAPAGRAWFASAFDVSTGAYLVHGGSDGLLQQDTWRVLLSGLPNDDAAGAFLVSNGTVSIDNRCASHGPTSCASDRDLWFRYDAPVSGSLTVSVTGASFTPRVAIHDASNPGGGPLACGTGTPPVASTIVVPGSYLIRVGSAPGANGGVGNLVVNGQPQPCPPVFNIANFNTFEHRLFEVTGTSNGLPWAWSIQRGGDLMFELNAPALAPGASASALAAAFAASINAHACADNRLFAVQIVPPYTNKFRVIVGGSTGFNLCMGPAGQLPTCCLPAAGTCAFNPDIREIMLSGEDCNANGEDDTIDLLVGTSTDLNENGVIDDCEVCLPDLDGNGVVGFPDLLRVLSAWGPCPKCPEDLDQNGGVGFGDLLMVLSAWGSCESG